jgi:transposase
MSAYRRKYSEEFKINAVHLVQASGHPVSDVARDFGINEALLYRWRAKYTPDGSLTPAATQEAELKRLRKENAELKIELDMLKKASAYFARNQK